MSTDLTIYREATPATLKTLGQAFAESGVFGCTNEAQGVVLALQCAAEKCTPLDLAKRYHIVSGKLSMKADTMLAEYRARGGKVIWTRTDADRAEARWTFDGNDLTLAYSTDDARAAGLLPAKPGSGWHKFPAAMLRARLISMAVRMLCPEAIAGTYTPEEIADFDSQPVSAKPSQPVPVSVEVMPAGPSTADKLAEAIGEHEAEVNAHLSGLGAIQPGQTWRDMPERSLAKLLRKLPEILNAKSE